MELEGLVLSSPPSSRLDPAHPAPSYQPIVSPPSSPKHTYPQPIQLHPAPVTVRRHAAHPALGQIQPLQLPHISQWSAHPAPQNTHTLSPSSSHYNGEASSPSSSRPDPAHPALGSIQPIQLPHISQWSANPAPQNTHTLSPSSSSHPAPQDIHNLSPSSSITMARNPAHPALGQIQPIQLLARSSPSSSLISANFQPTQLPKTHIPSAHPAPIIVARHPARPALGQIQPLQLPHISQWSAHPAPQNTHTLSPSSPVTVARNPAHPALGQIHPIQPSHSRQWSAHPAPQNKHTLSPSSSHYNGEASSTSSSRPDPAPPAPSY
ncbi:hypothetical protein PCANC_06834 [Puccinia coronata f. sp. avenae]|uniref:Uncharacterized protein n=2 Tax=Puccinia coronata f. sp. avenae TaxID=200324 RepID=A0A2N5VVH9_9BASI|nr:hypothetical protein PCANC_06834 [Puccinia coronata f. sp. avenae]